MNPLSAASSVVVVGDLDAGAGLPHSVADGVGDGGRAFPDQGIDRRRPSSALTVVGTDLVA